jgi:RNA polymerase sigma factor (sigma-70 family)
MAYHSARVCGPSDTDLAEYLRQIRGLPLITAPEERELARRFQEEGCEHSRDRLVCANLRLVVYVAKRYSGLGLPLQDLVEAGNIGLLHAVRMFDHHRGTRFATYAVYWIRQSVLHAVAAGGDLIRVPSGHRRAARICSDVAAKLSASLGRPATTSEVASSAGMSARVVQSAMTRTRSVALSGGEDAAQHMGGVADTRTDGPDESVATGELRERLRAFVHTLPGIESQVIRLHYGLGGRSALTLRDISRELGVPVIVVQRALQAGLGRLELLLGTRREGSAKDTAAAAAG